MGTDLRDNARPVVADECETLRRSNLTPAHPVPQGSAKRPRRACPEPVEGHSSTGKRGYALNVPSRPDASRRSLGHEAVGAVGSTIVFENMCN